MSIALIGSALSTLGCGEHTAPSTALAAVAKVDRLFPSALSWYLDIEAQSLPLGRALSEAETGCALALGLLHPERVRVVVLAQFPLPGAPELRAEALRLGFGTRREDGRTMGDVVMLKPASANDRTLLVHELVHVQQQDRLGRVGFLRQILYELATVGYEQSPLEREAYGRQRSPCAPLSGAPASGAPM